jgi:Ca2+/Na+ antiporter
MNWKEFLKPDWKKIILSIVLFGFLFSELCFFGGETGVKYDILMKICIIMGFVAFIISIPAYLFVIPFSYIALILNLTPAMLYALPFGNAIYSYFLSCFIIWLYKMKKNMRNIETGYEQERQKKFVEKRNIAFKIKLDKGDLLFYGSEIGFLLWGVTSNQINWSMGIVLFLTITLFYIMFISFIRWIRERMKKK